MTTIAIYACMPRHELAAEAGAKITTLISPDQKSRKPESR
jgi:hypothetical protein